MNAFIAAAAARVRNPAEGVAALVALARETEGEAPDGESLKDRLARRRIHSYSYRDLALETGEAAAGDPAGHARAFDMVAKQLDVQAPSLCALAIVSNLGRTVVVAKDERGMVLGRTAKNQWRWVDRRGDRLVPPDVQAALRGCRRVQVLASPGIFGLSRVLQDVPWSYVVASKHAPAAGGAQGTSVVVANIDPPAELHLERPELIRAGDRGPGTRALEGSRATFSQVVQALRTASEFEFYGHGMQKPNDAEGSYLVLAPDPEKQNEFRLTGRDIPELDGAPDVYLKACVTADAGFQSSEARSLASAFIERGARSAFAATVSIPDRGANLFFNRIRELRNKGLSPAEALGEARNSFKKDGQFQPWMDDVVCLEPA